MIVDTSAIIAVLRAEPDWHELDRAMRVPPLRMSAGTLLETSIVVDRARDPRLSRRLDELLATLGVEIVPVSEEQARVARQAYRDFGKFSGHPARLNFGDCFAYALAAVIGEPLLFKGDDFRHTDVRSALPREDRGQ